MEPTLPDLSEPSHRPIAKAIVQAGYPRRPMAKPGHEADLKQRTLTNLYNTRPAWLAMAHEALDQAVAATYGWDVCTPDMVNDETLRRILEMNRKLGEP